SVGRLNEMAKQYADRADFLTVYIKEAHAQDEWRMDQNDKENICYPQPKTTDARRAIPADFVERFHYATPLLVDPIRNGGLTKYAAWPERLYVIAADGTLAYVGKPGPFDYHPEELDAWLQAHAP